MLVLSRNENQTIIFPNLDIRVEVVRIKGKNVRIGIQAPKAIRMIRGELAESEGQSDPSTNLSSVTDVLAELNSKIETASLNSRHELRNHLNSASLSVNVAQKQLEQGCHEQAEKFLAQAIESLRMLNEQLSDCKGPTESSEAHHSETKPSGDPRKSLAGIPVSPLSQRCWKALIVEDNPNERELLASVLKMSGFEVDAVADGNSAIQHLERYGRPDVVLMDMNMPQLNGPQTVAKIRTDMGDRSLPIFGVSGLTQDEAQLPTGRQGVTGWFSKPVNADQLVRYLRCELESLAPAEVN